MNFDEYEEAELREEAKYYGMSLEELVAQKEYNLSVENEVKKIILDVISVQPEQESSQMHAVLDGWLEKMGSEEEQCEVRMEDVNLELRDVIVNALKRTRTENSFEDAMQVGSTFQLYCPDVQLGQIILSHVERPEYWKKALNNSSYEKDCLADINQMLKKGMLNFDDYADKKELMENVVNREFYSVDLQILHKAGLQIDESTLADLMRYVDFYSNDVISKVIELGATQSEVALPEPKESTFEREEMSEEDKEFYDLLFSDYKVDPLEQYSNDAGEALKAAIKRSNQEWIEILLESGYDANFKANSESVTPLTYALAQKKLGAAIQLIEAGGIIDNQGKEVLAHLSTHGEVNQSILEIIKATEEKQTLERSMQDSQSFKAGKKQKT
ncbi:MAG TPA: hypothetical protein VM577_19420 [Anaerovoracaceae bacterium]|nr:hypothetical protein [Anaerovoracaceae bacterium]